MSRVFKSGGQRKAPPNYDNDNSRQMTSPGVYIGIVKKNNDPQYMGRLQVWIEAFGGDPENEQTWISVSYASPFAGTTSIFEQGTNVAEYSDTIKSYGWWAVPPDIEARVLVAFADGGKLDKGYWFACLYQRSTQITVPGIPAKNTHTGENKPAAPKNKKDLDPDLEKYVEHKPMSDALKKQGLEKDFLRGLTSSSAMRETPSKVLGLLTPGQHQFVLDDGDKDGNNRLIRLRTTNGTQLLLDDVAGHIYMISKNGENWVEMSADGKVHIYANSDINIRSQANINMYADSSVNIEAGQAVNIKTNGGSIKLESANEISTYATSNTKITSLETSNINSGVAHYETAGVIHMNGPVADVHQLIDTYQLTVNQGVTESICSIVPEHEPWAGHSGTINPTGHGNQQMQKDPAPDEQPRQPKPNETPAPIQKEELEGENIPTVKKLDEVTTSPEAQENIKESNGFSPVNVKDGDGESGGYGSAILTKDGNPVDANGNPIGEAIQDETGATGNIRRNPETGELYSSSLRLNEETGTYYDTAPNTTASQNNLPAAPTPGFDLQLPSGTGSVSLSAAAFSAFKKLTDASDALLGTGVTSSPSPNLQPGPALSKEQIQEILGKGITPAKANAMFANDISRNETDVKKVLKAANVTDVPQGAFDGLVSMQNQLGDITYTYVNGEKIDMRPLYKGGDWAAVASFIAADERDRPRRIREAAMIAKNDYGPKVNENNIIDQGMSEAAELLAKGKLNKQTGSPGSNQQVVALATSYIAVQGTSLPNQSTALKLAAAKNYAEEDIVEKYRRQAGPWPY